MQKSLSCQQALRVTAPRCVEVNARAVLRCAYLCFLRDLGQSAQAEQDTLILCSKQESVTPAPLNLLWVVFMMFFRFGSRLQLVERCPSARDGEASSARKAYLRQPTTRSVQCPKLNSVSFRGAPPVTSVDPTRTPA